MASSHRPSRRILGIVVSIALLASIAGPGLAAAAPKPKAPAPSGESAPGGASAGLFELSGNRLDAKLKERVKSAVSPKDRDARVDVAVLVAKGTKPPKELEMPLKLALRADPKHDLYAGRAKVRSLEKIATSAGVTKVFDNGRITPPPIPDKPLPSKAERAKAAKAAKARLQQAAKAGALTKFRSLFDADGVQVRPARRPLSSKDAVLRGADAAYDGGGATGWFDVSPRGHNSAAAWDAGYTGAGVKVAVADDSVDFAHPDLQGTQAIVSDPASPHHGWPEAFDPFSALLYAYDVYYGTSFVHDGQTWWSDTSATITETDPTFDGKTFVTPGTSKSGTYHIGYLWDENLYAWMSGWSEYPAVLVSDETTPGVYDTVYVDVWMDHDFSYEKPCTMSSPISYLDYWDSEAETYGPDGYADLSGGMVYWIADGANQPPGFEFILGGHDPSAPVPGNGDLVCFMGALNFDEYHGTLCASNVVGQGMTDGPSDPIMDDGVYPPFKTPTGGGDGIVQGAARDSKVVAFSDIYWNFFTSTLLAYDYAAFGADMQAGTGDEVQTVSNSYGDSAVDADEWDYHSRYVTALNTQVNATTTFLFSTGNGAPGYGTNAPPTPSTGIGVGASTQLGACGGWDSIYDADQVTVGDVIPWSNRGPSAMGHAGPSVVADGAYSSGAMALNQGAWDGWRSWIVWGGTSRSCPVAAGNLALIYDAFKQRFGRYPTWSQARDYLMAGARDLGYDSAVQGAGMVDAKKSIDLITGTGGVEVTPSQWVPGDYRGSSYLSFPSVVHPGMTYEGSVQVWNRSADSDVDVAVMDRTLEQVSATSMLVELDGTNESPYDFNRPDWVSNITAQIRDWDPDLVVIRTATPFADFAPTGAFNTSGSTHNTTRLLAYDWKDQDSDGSLWADADSDGYVDPGEMDPGEYMRFTYSNNFANSHEIRIQHPLDRMHDGVFLGLQHSNDATADKTVQVQIVIELYREADHPWLSSAAEDTTQTLLASSAIDVPLTLTVPSDAKPGFYEGEYVITTYRGGDTFTSIVPVHITVASNTPNFSFGTVDDGMGAAALRPTQVATDDPSPILPNSEMFGGQSWNWRAESGDWRFFMADVQDDEPLPPGATWLVKTEWPDGAGAVDTDIDTLLYGPSDDEWSSIDPTTFGPHGMELKGGSANTNIGAGIWLWQTATGTTQEWVAGPLERGLNEIMLHSVVWSGESWREPVSGQAGIVGVDPSSIAVCESAGSGSVPLQFTTTMDLNGLAAEAYGLSKRLYYPAEEITQSEDKYYDLSLTGAAYLDVAISAAGGSDLDLYVYWFDGSGWQLVGASETATGDEHVRIEQPADGSYLIDVYGYSVSGTDTFELTASYPMGGDLQVSGLPSGPLSAGQVVPLSVDWTKYRGDLAEREGDFEGVVYLGPTEAPRAIAIPFTLHYPFEVEQYTPNPSEPALSPTATVEIQFSKRLDESSITDGTFVVTDGTETLALDVSVDGENGTVMLTPQDTLKSSTEYLVEIDGLLSRDGDELTTTLPFSTTDALVRAMGDTRYDTAVAASQQTFDSADTVVLATGEKFPDALSASGLAGQVKGPVLLTKPDTLLPQVRDEIVRLGATQVFIIGGTGAVSGSVASAVDALPGVAVERIAGVDRYATAAQVARKIAELRGGPVDGAFLVRGDDFADGVAVSPPAYRMAMPVLLTRTGELPASTRSAITDVGVSTVWIAGGTGAVSGSVASAVDALPGVAVERMAGADRYATAVAVADKAVENGWLTWTVVGVATGKNFPDALTGGVASGAKEGVLLLTEPTMLSPDTKTAIESHTSEILKLTVFGGPGAVSAAVSNAIADLLW
ncbi:cell wall-binding repeat-containing protein [Coriobacteriia bacterium Es71-Z0120]|uniref:cell wall-binding repeat-containing protein n=1 Tax=Parvivirga hydrogeniphila TaxID=2939460 RepID=UPI002260AA7A|nr:cell wall-binding repeat-containing protein [Parvivirga hydrogeniphila]MCL4079210.1 cell wall-binding repeat-containing protein [Parvivirga hydrogeniphila]